MAILRPLPELGPHVNVYHRFWLTCSHLRVLSGLVATSARLYRFSCVASLAAAYLELGFGGRQVAAAGLWSQF